MSSSITGRQSRTGRLRLSLAALVALMLPLTMGASAGNGSDGRATDPRAEIVAQYVHSLDRQPTDAEIGDRMGFVKTNCDWGILDASYRLATSDEAKSRWNNNPQDLAGMLYASLLDRAPDPVGLTTYTNNIATRGLGWSTAEMLGSPEYRGRLDALCGKNRNPTATMYDWQSAAAQANYMMEVARSMAVTCNVVELIKQVVVLDFGGEDKESPESRQKLRSFITTTGEITNEVHGRIDGTCDAAVTMVEAAREIAVVIDAGGGYNPVMFYARTKEPWYYAKFLEEFRIRIGPDPVTWKEFNGRSV